MARRPITNLEDVIWYYDWDAVDSRYYKKSAFVRNLFDFDEVLGWTRMHLTLQNHDLDSDFHERNNNAFRRNNVPYGEVSLGTNFWYHISRRVQYEEV